MRLIGVRTRSIGLLWEQQSRRRLEREREHERKLEQNDSKGKEYAEEAHLCTSHGIL